MDIKFFTEKLQEFLADLPGMDAHRLMAPSSRLRELSELNYKKEPVKSSVLILLYPNQGNICMVLIQRPDYDGVHGGQIAFPGGKYESSDLDLKTTALRETEEEVGVKPDNIKMIGRLSDLYIPPSNFMVSPFIGYTEQVPTFNIDPHEVAGIITISVDDLFNDEYNKEVSIPHRKYGDLHVPAFVINDHIIWGATAMMLAEFKTIIERFYLGMMEL